MSDIIKKTENNIAPEKINTEVKQVQNTNKPEQRVFEKNRSKIRSKRDKRPNDRKQEKDQFDHKIISIRRVAKMNKGGRRMNLSVFVVVGDRKGRVGLGLGKGEDVRAAQDKAISKAKKNLVFITLKGNTIPHEILHKFRASRILLKPASPGTGIIAGSSVRMVAEVAGISDILAKILGANNRITNAYATVEALSLLRSSKL